MTKKLLFTLDALGHKVPVYRVHASEMVSARQVGQCNAFKEELFLLDRIPGGPVADAEVLVHELLHLASSLSLPDDNELTEQQVLVLSMVLTNLLLRNPKLVAYLLKRLR